MAQNKRPRSGSPDPRDPRKKIPRRNTSDPNMAFRKEASRKRASLVKPTNPEKSSSFNNQKRPDRKNSFLKEQPEKERKTPEKDISEKEKKALAKKARREEKRLAAQEQKRDAKLSEKESKSKNDPSLESAASEKEAAKDEKKNVQYEEQRGFRIGGRIVLASVCLLLSGFMGYLIYKQYEIQVKDYEVFSKQASDMHWKRIEDVPTRGDILDSNGNILASTTYEYTIGMTPSDVLKSQDKKNGQTNEEIAAAFAEYVGADYDKMIEWLKDTEAPYIQIIKNVNLEQMKALSAYISEKGIGGVKIDTVPKRYYTYDNLAAQIIGFADQSDNSLIGQIGIEAYFNSDLTGTKGYTYAEVDNYNRSVLPYSAPTTIEAVDGYNVQLTMDMNIQRIAEEACRDAYDEYKPKEGVTCIVMDPFTGEIKAMVSMPDFNLNTARSKPYGISEEKWNSMASEDRVEYLMRNAWRNRCVSDTYEPGSTMKALTTAMALEEGVTYEDEVFSDAPIKISSVDTISCWREKTEEGNHGDETLRQAFERSCNPIFVQLAQRIKPEIDKYYDYIRNLGFYDVTGVDLPAEGKGIFHAHPTEVDLASLSFGESSTVTPLQLITAYSALVNGGSLLRPHIAARLIDRDGNIVREYTTEKIRTVFSVDTTKRVRSLLESVVSSGTGAQGYVPGYYVAGKTSTSTIEVGEDKDMHVISFVCHAPAYNPKIAVLLIINKPEDKDLGSSAPAKVAARIVEGTLEYMGIQRRLSDSEYKDMLIEYTIPDVVGKTFSEARSELMEKGFDAVDGFGTMTADTIVGTMYYGDTKSGTLCRNAQIILYPGEVSEAEMTTTVIPDFEGMNIVEAQRMAKQYGLNIMVEGNIKGTVVSQTPLTTIGNDRITPTPTPNPDGEGEEGSSETNETEETVEGGSSEEGSTAETNETESSQDDPESSSETNATGEDGEDTSDSGNGESGSDSSETTAPAPKRVLYGTVVYLKLQ